MKIGLLNAFTPQEESDLGVTELESFEALLRPVAPDWELVEYRVTEGGVPVAVDACDGWLITGSPQGVYDGHPWIETLSAFIREAYIAGRPQVGICFGHQLLAHALGGRAEKSTRGWGIGLHEVDLSVTPPWFDPLLERPALYYCHQDQVTELPPGAAHLGGDSRCPNALFAIDSRVLGVQGHPEFTTPLMTELIEQMEPRVGRETTAEAAASLNNGHPANEAVARTIVNFLSLSQSQRSK